MAGAHQFLGECMASRAFHCLVVFPFLLFASARAAANTLRITSTPSGAKVEIEGTAGGTTPFQTDFPRGYFRRPLIALSRHLDHSLVARITLDGYIPKEIKLTEGPLTWDSLNGRSHVLYYRFKSDHFEVQLQPIKLVFNGSVTTNLADGAADLQPELSLAELIQKTKPAVLFLKGAETSGTGFFVTDTGVIATNAHLARGEESLEAVLPGGDQLEAKVVYVDDDLDIALAKVEGQGFPRLTLADAATVRQGENVIAIGNPGEAMKFSVTKGIVSGVGAFPDAGPGTWIQTDAPINPGNSGGPLLNGHGEVIGINTLKLVRKDVTGIGFALSASDLIEVLHRFYPSSVPAREPLAAPVGKKPATAPATAAAPAPAPENVFGTVRVNAPEGAEITVDGRPMGGTPATLKLKAGLHRIVVNDHQHADWIRLIFVLGDSDVTLTPNFPPM